MASMWRRALSDALNRWARKLVEDDDHVDLRVELDGRFVGRVERDTVGETILIPGGLRTPGMYRISAGRRSHGSDFSRWYVGRSMRAMHGRVQAHVSDEYDEVTGKGKRFAQILRDEDGWVDVYQATAMRVNGVNQLRMQPPESREDDPEEWATVELVYNLIEAAGLASSLVYRGAESKR